MSTANDVFRASCNARHAATVEAGEHDELCEWRDAGHFLCNCSKRRREAAGFTKAPSLVHRYPLCDRCWEEVNHTGDSWECERCHVSWRLGRGDDDRGEFTDDYGVLDTSPWDGVPAL